MARSNDASYCFKHQIAGLVSPVLLPAPAPPMSDVAVTANNNVIKPRRLLPRPPMDRVELLTRRRPHLVTVIRPIDRLRRPDSLGRDIAGRRRRRASVRYLCRCRDRPSAGEDGIDHVFVSTTAEPARPSGARSSSLERMTADRLMFSPSRRSGPDSTCRMRGRPVTISKGVA